MKGAGDGVSRYAAEVRAEARRAVLRSRMVRARTQAVRKEVGLERALPARLSSREGEVLTLLSSGLTSKDIALQLGISANTVNYHLANIYRKLGAHSRVAAANAYFRRQTAPSR